MSQINRHSETQKVLNAIKQAEKNGNADAQRRLYQKLVKLQPSLVMAWAQFAKLNFEAGDQQGGRDASVQALALPGDDRADRLLETHWSQDPFFSADLERARRWYTQFPSEWRLQIIFDALTRFDQPNELENVLAKHLEGCTEPSRQAFTLNLMFKNYFALARYHDAVACCKLGVELLPNHTAFEFNMALVLEELGQYTEAFKYYQKILAREPEHIGVNNNLALLMLRLGQYPEGWSHYEWRWARVQKDRYQHFNIPRWEGQALAGKRLLIWAEQGIGDNIMFGSMLPDLLALGATVNFEVYERLEPLFKRAFPTVNFVRREVITRDGGDAVYKVKQRWPASDYQIPEGSLGGLLRQSASAFIPRTRFLQADPEVVATFVRTYQQAFPGKRLVGLSWRGGTSSSTQKQTRRISMQDLARLAVLQDVQFINLQYGDTLDERAEALALGLCIHNDDSVDPLHDMDRQGAQMLALDAVVSIDNTTVHLAGALGVKTYALLPINPNWRWGLHSGPSHWYPTVHTLRNRKILDWDEVMADVIAHLAPGA
ncbi:tetratricopeptide repeat-containing glycosyltransferase family protein [Pseudomonas typographi]|uniref:tetratricopeptide repeat-containing glycosyltransferase family protein n=1 Tax=Pseudomonas typographi TaxID=2715964 RepID=UPI0016871EF5|nr:tetratricopeptide repeat-containing glycosyltransferase family protein [Pseudomonas typographi]MBD1550668.1 hypothetical protein [Pseudomonas typographi]